MLLQGWVLILLGQLPGFHLLHVGRWLVGLFWRLEEAHFWVVWEQVWDYYELEGHTLEIFVVIYNIGFSFLCFRIVLS